MKKITHILAFILLGATTIFAQGSRGIVIEGKTTPLNESRSYKFKVEDGDKLNFYENGAKLETVTLTETPILVSTTLHSPFAGSGTSGTPYLISNATELAAMRDLINAGVAPYANAGIHWRVTQNFSLSGNWTPIGTYTSLSVNAPFRGNFNGDGKTISGLTVNRSEGYNGLFGYINGGTIRNLGLTNVNITVTGNTTGGIAGRMEGSGNIMNCYVGGTISGEDYTGGLVGNLYSTVTNCYSSATVIGNNRVGGIAGYVTNDGKISNCYATGAISGEINVGGIAGFLNPSTVLTGCVALNPTITRTGTGTATTLRRLIGGVGTAGSQTLEDNAAFGYMTVRGSVVTGGNANNLNGADISGTAAKTQTTYSSAPRSWAFGSNESSPWRWGLSTAYLLPTLWWQSAAPDMPAHLNKTVEVVGEQQRKISVGDNDDEGWTYYYVATTGIANGTYPTTVENLPGGISLQQNVTITNDGGNLLLRGGGTVLGGTYTHLRLVIDGAISAPFTLVISHTPVTSISIIPESSVQLTVGSNVQLTAVVSPSDATKPLVVWSSLQPTIASVNGVGLVTGTGAGTVNIIATATDGTGLYALKSVTVTSTSSGTDPTSVSFANSTIYTWHGRETNLGMSVSPIAADRGKITWTQTSSDSQISASHISSSGTGSAATYVRTNPGSVASTGESVTLTARLPNSTTATVTLKSRFNMAVATSLSGTYMSNQFNLGTSYTWQRGATNTRYIRAYYGANETQWSASAVTNPETGLTKIGTSNYTITSSDPDITVTKNADGNTYELTRTSSSVFKQVTLTITVDYQTYTQVVNLLD